MLDLKKLGEKPPITITALVVTIAVCAIGIFDLIFVLVKGSPSSISNYLVNLGFKDPVVVFTFGFICGHLFGYMRPVKPI